MILFLPHPGSYLSFFRWQPHLSFCAAPGWQRKGRLGNVSEVATTMPRAADICFCSVASFARKRITA